MVFKIGSDASGDYSNRVIAGTYNVNNDPIRVSWTDSNGVEHKNKIRDRVVGTFDMFFRDISEYNTFVALIKSLQINNEESVLCSVAVNNDVGLHTGYFYIEYTPTRNIKGDWSDYMEQFTVKITEK